MPDIQATARQLAGNGAAIRGLVQNCSDAQAQWKPDPESWSMQQVMEHMYNEERIDFRKHLREWYGAAQPEQYIAVADWRQALERFLLEREASIEWLKTLEWPDWDATKQFRFGSGETYTFSAGEMLVSWVDHDYLHLRQIIELLHFWHEQQAAPYSVRYAGRW
jgi:hypothetical protein